MTLLANHTIGRDERSDLPIPDQRISLSHAAVRWDGSQWLLRDMGSTNKTFLNGVPLPLAAAPTLRPDDEIDFGTASRWRVVDVSRPLPTATLVGSGERVTSADIDTLPLSPSSCLYRGDRGVWHTRDGRKQDDFRDGDEIVVDAIPYRLSLPDIARPTAPAGGLVGRSVSDISLAFRVSLGEDRIEIAVAYGSTEKALGRQGNNRVLLLLARARLADKADQLAPSIAGWRSTEEICRATYGDDLPRLNTEVHRIRKRFAALGLVSFADIVERDEEFIRIGVDRLSIREL